MVNANFGRFNGSQVRRGYPALRDGFIRFDPLTANIFSEPVAKTLAKNTLGLTSLGYGSNGHDVEVQKIIYSARDSFANMVGGLANNTVLGYDRFGIISALAQSLLDKKTGCNIVVSRSSDEENFVPWGIVAASNRIELRESQIDAVTGVLDPEQFISLIDKRTRVVVLSLIQSQLGIINQIDSIAQKVHEYGGFLVLDATNAAGFFPININDTGADAIILAANKWGGPKVCSIVFKDDRIVSELKILAPKFLSHTNIIIETWEHNALMLSAVKDSVEFMANLGILAGVSEYIAGSIQDKLSFSLTALQDYHERLTRYFFDQIVNSPKIKILGPQKRRVPLFTLLIDQSDTNKIIRRLYESSIIVSPTLPSRALSTLGVNRKGMTISLGFYPFTTPYDVDTLIRAIVPALG